MGLIFLKQAVISALMSGCMCMWGACVLACWNQSKSCHKSRVVRKEKFRMSRGQINKWRVYVVYCMFVCTFVQPNCTREIPSKDWEVSYLILPFLSGSIYHKFYISTIFKYKMYILSFLYSRFLDHFHLAIFKLCVY